MRLVPTFFLFFASVTPGIAKATDHDNLINALILTESHGKMDAVGDGGKAFGCLQIHSVMVQEANRIGNSNYTHRDMFDPQKSLAVARIVLGHYSRVIENKTGRPATTEELAYIWNGGGSAWRRADHPINDQKQKNLMRYWAKVRQNLH